MIAFHYANRTEPAHVVRHSASSRRLRLHVPAIAGDRHLARRFEAIAHAWPGVLDATANPRSGRMLLHYAPGAPLLGHLREQPPSATDRANEKDTWHARPTNEVFTRLGSSPGGLDPREATRRLHRHGSNLAAEEAPRSRLALLVDQLSNVPMALLAGAAGASALLGEIVEAGAILVAVGINAGIGYRIEHQNQQVLTAWRRLEGGIVQAIRGGRLLSIPAAELVPGDVILVRAGDVVPADARVIDAHRLAADEAPLTGESEPQPRQPEPVRADAPLAERSSMLYAGTAIAGGHGRAIVVATGGATELARVRALVEKAEAPPPPLAVRMERLGRRVAGLSLAVAGVATAANLLHGRPARTLVRGAVALGVAALPEGLPLVATSALVRSMQRLHGAGMVVRRVAAAESLGGVTVICADKTGTLTRNEMRLELLEVGGRAFRPDELRADRRRLFDDPLTTALAAALLNSDVDVQGRAERAGSLAVAGSATERALVDAAHAAGLDGAELRRSFPRLRLIERTRDAHYVVSLHRDRRAGGVLAFVKGAPEQVLDLCTPDVRDDPALRARNEELAAAGLRVLALAWRRLADPSADAGDYRFLGFACLRDPLRTGAAEAIRRASRAGIRTLILTGDQRRTAAAIADQLGLRGEVLAASDLAQLDEAALAERLLGAAVLARVTPEDKVRIVRALRRRGEVVAMAGDGINDAPALKAADVGIAVGARASDLARQVADVVMAGEDLRSILHAVGEGRIVQDNLRRSLRFLFATNLSEMALVLGAAIAGAREPLRPLQLLWINLLTDTLPGLALALEPGAPEILDRPPARPGADLLGPVELRTVGRDALFLAGVGAAGLALGGPSLAFATLTAAQLSYASVCRAPRQLRSSEGARADARFGALVGSGAILHLAALTFPPLRRLLRVTAPTPLTLAGFAAGLALPHLARGATSTHVVVRRGGRNQTEDRP